jgi:hypothetical protein
VRFVHGDAFSALPHGPFDLIVCAELLYYAGTRVGGLARRMIAEVRPAGRLVVVHPWPESATLHAPFRDSADLTLVREVIHQDPVRPYAIAMFERR